MILFGYGNFPTWGRDKEKDSRFSIEILDNKTLNYKLFDENKNIELMDSYSLDENIFNSIKDMLLKYKEKIEVLEENINYMSCDGSSNSFVVMGKKFITWNIQFYKFDEKDKNSREYILTEIFNEIADILKEENISLNFDTFSK